MKNKIQTKHIFLSLFLMTIFIFSIPQTTKAETQFYLSTLGEDQIQDTQAIAWCENLEYGGYNDWHLASVTELAEFPIVQYQFGWINSPGHGQFECTDILDMFSDDAPMFPPGDPVTRTLNSQNNGCMAGGSAPGLCARTVATGGEIAGEPDTDLVAGFETMKTTTKDNISPLVMFILAIFGAVLVLTLLIVALNWGIRRLTRDKMWYEQASSSLNGYYYSDDGGKFETEEEAINENKAIYYRATH